MVRAPRLATAPPDLDQAQQAAVAHDGPLLRVLGGPGSGTSTTAVEIVVDAVRHRRVSPDECLLLSPSRTLAAALREQVTARLGGTTTEALARTPASFGFGLLRQVAALNGLPAPRLLSGPEQDVLLRELLAGHARGEGKVPRWPPRVAAALATRGFRAELRDLLMRAVERGLEPKHLVRLGEQHGRPEWVAAATVLEEYDEVTAFSRPGSYDPAWILGAASDLLEDDPRALARVREKLRLLVVDDAQELTTAGLRLLEVVRSPAMRVVLLGDPDTGVHAFRGADPRILGTGWESLGAGDTVVLGTSHRQPAALREVGRRVTERIGALGGTAHRQLHTVEGGAVEVHLLRAQSQEAALVASTLRQAHLLHGVPWAQMAVVMRGQATMSPMRRVLAASGVPVTVQSQVPVRDEVAVRPLLALLDVVLRRALGHASPLDPHVLVDVLQSPLGGADAVSLRRLRWALRQEELEAGGGRTSDELLVAAVLDPSLLPATGSDAVAARRVAATIAAGVEAAATVSGPAADGGVRWVPGVTAETVLWAMWQASGLAPSWRRTALAGGPAGTRADRDLDAVVALFDAAARYVDRLPQLGPAEFLEHVRGQDVPGDTLVARAPEDDTVALLTAQAAAGREWRLVVVAGVQEGVWPDLRLRGSLLGSEQLVDVVSGRGSSLRAAQAAVRYDETRLFLTAVTRASERLVVTAVRSDDVQPSVYLDLVDPPDEGSDQFELRRFSDVPPPLTLPALVAELRVRAAWGGSAYARAEAAAQLARLAAHDVSGADPASWWALAHVSDPRPLRGDGEMVSVSPSKIQDFHDCGLRWLLVTSGGGGPAVGSATVGTFVHDLLAELPDAGEGALHAEVEARWGRLGLPTGWLARRQRADVHAMVTRFARQRATVAGEGWELVAPELKMTAELGRGHLVGRVDRLERNAAGELRVVDIKTGATKPKDADVARHAQLGAYQLAVRERAFEEHGTTSAGAALLHIGKGGNAGGCLQQQDPLGDGEEPRWADDLLAATVEGMAAATFTATVGPWCKRCPVRSSCPAHPEGGSL